MAVSRPTTQDARVAADDVLQQPHFSAPSLVRRFAERFGVDANKLIETLKATAFKVKDTQVSNEQMMALLVVADQYKLNPFTREIFAFPDKQNGIVPVVSVDGWSRIINERPELNGIEFRYSEELIEPKALKGLLRPAHAWIECVIYRKDRDRPVVIREWLEEVYRPPFEGRGNDGKPYTKDSAWQTHTRRFHRHKTLIQCARVAFGFAGIYDEDEAQRIVDVTASAEVIERRPLVDSVRRKSSPAFQPEDPPPPSTTEPEVTPEITLETLCEQLKSAESDERIDYLCTVAKETLSESGIQAFLNAAAERTKQLEKEE